MARIIYLMGKFYLMKLISVSSPRFLQTIVSEKKFLVNLGQLIQWVSGFVQSTSLDAPFYVLFTYFYH